MKVVVTLNINPLRFLFIRQSSCLCAFVAFLLFSENLFSQNLEKIGKKDMITIGGGMNFNSIIYNAYGFEPRRDPYTWYFNGNLNVNILDVSLPFTFSYSNLHGTYTQPFNMQSCSPKYKWIQAHIGTTTMNFSDYTLAGHVFTGAGIELTPKVFYFGAMYGRFNKEVQYDFENSSYDNMSFKRMGFAGKAGFNKNGNAISVSYINAKDDANSLLLIPADAHLSPQQNAALSLAGKWKLFKLFSIDGEYAISGLTRNILSGNESTDFNGLEKFILQTKTTTQFFHALKASLTYSLKRFSISLKHENVDPDFQTFGAYYFNNDFTNWTIAPSFHLLKGKLSVNLNAGWQHNNLDATKLNTSHRWVGSSNINYAPSPAWNFTAMYSNFTSYTNHRLQSDPFWVPSPADTLSFYQVAQQANTSIVHSFGNKSVKQSVSLIGSYQLTGLRQNNLENSNSEILNGNLVYSTQFSESKLSLSVLTNCNLVYSGLQVNKMFGPGVQCNKSIRKVLKISGGVVYNRAYTNKELTANLLSNRAQLAYSPVMKNKMYGKPSFSVNAIYVNKFPVSTSVTKTGELTITANLGINF